MAELIPIEELIVQNIVTTLDGVTAGATYATTLSSKAPEQSTVGDSPVNGMVLVESVGCDERGGVVTGKADFTLKVDIVGTAIVSEKAVADTVRKRLSQMAADIKKALQQDRYRGNYAHNTRFVPRDSQGADTEYADGSPPAVIVHCSIDFRVDAPGGVVNPYSL